MSSKNNNQKNISSLVEAINNFFTGFIERQALPRNHIENMVELFQHHSNQVKLAELIQENIPKSTRVQKKKLKDPNAPKRPKSSYLFFCDEHRADVKEANSELKMPQISSKLGEMWKSLSERKKAKYDKKAEQAKEEYKKLMETYVRPDDEELAKLDVNHKGRRRSSNGESKKKNKKDPNAPKRPMTAFLYFSKDKRPEIKEANPDMKVGDIAKELGRLWKEDFADEESRKIWVKKAKKDKKRYDDEMSSYVPPESSGEESVPKKKRSSSKSSKNEEDGDDENEEDKNNENEEDNANKKQTGKVKENKKKQTDKSTKFELSKESTMNIASTNKKHKKPLEEEDLSDEDLFLDE